MLISIFVFNIRQLLLLVKRMLDHLLQLLFSYLKLRDLLKLIDLYLTLSSQLLSVLAQANEIKLLL